jgi:hypothetical protein
VIELAYPQKNITSDGVISFPKLQSWNPVTMDASIVAEVNGKRITCRINKKVLEKKFQLANQEPMSIVTEFRNVLELAARNLIEENKFEADGSIMIRIKDL